MKSGRTFFLLLIFCLFAILSVAQSEKKISLGEQAVFKIVKTKEPIIVDGKMTETIWKKTEARNLENFYRLEVPADKQQTTFRMAWDDENLYVFFYFEDKFITAGEKNRDGQPYLDDCGEIFIIPVPDSLDTHFGFELNLYKASNDFIYFNDYYKGQDYVLKAFNPEFEVETSYEGTINDNSDEDVGWSLEMAIPFTNFYSLKSLVPVKSGNQWAFLVVRQDRNELEGTRHSTSTLFPIYDISKGVHQSNHFGLMQFVE
jgi:hypothetical protein